MTHREIAEQLRKDPSLVKNDEFVKNHPALQTYLQQHPEVRRGNKGKSERLHAAGSPLRPSGKWQAS